MAQAQLAGMDIDLHEVWHLSDEEDARERTLSGHRMDNLYIYAVKPGKL